MKAFVLWSTLFLNFACVTVPKHEVVVMNTDTTLKKVIWKGVSGSDKDTYRTKAWIAKNNQWPETQKVIRDFLIKNYAKIPQYQINHAVNLYISKFHEPDLKLVERLIDSNRKSARRAGWQITADLPSKKVKQWVEDYLSMLVVNNREKEIYLEEVGRSIAANRIDSSYSILKSALMQTGLTEFAQAMSQMKPRQSSNDFLFYLSQASPEDLRQLTIKSVNPMTCTHILKHMKKYPPSSSQQLFSYLFFYAVSRYPAFSELTMEVLDPFFASHDRDYLSALLTRLPKWTQLAFVENARRSLNSNKRLFLLSLKKNSALRDVVDEIDGLRL